MIIVIEKWKRFHKGDGGDDDDDELEEELHPT
jgi:hypothetical protein